MSRTLVPESIIERKRPQGEHATEDRTVEERAVQTHGVEERAVEKLGIDKQAVEKLDIENQVIERTGSETQDSGTPFDLEFPAPAAPVEFEFVLGRPQIASISLVVLALLAVSSVAAYMVGKSEANIATVSIPLPSPSPSSSRGSTPGQVADASSTTAGASVVSSVQQVDARKHGPSLDEIRNAPLGGTVEKGKLYLQLGYVERGFATLMVHGSRELGYPAFIAPGSSETAYRVLSGPYSDMAEYEKAKNVFTAMGLRSFPRRNLDAPAGTAAPTQPDKVAASGRGNRR